jgi:hypothetical protein
MDCTRINSTLQKLLLGGAEKLSDSSLGIIQTKQERNDVYSISDLDIRWRLISGKVTSPESRMLLSQALAIFHVSASAFQNLELNLYVMAILLF